MVTDMVCLVKMVVANVTLFFFFSIFFDFFENVLKYVFIIIIC